MEVTTICRKWSTRVKPGIPLWTLEILEKRIAHQLLAPVSRRDHSVMKRHGRAKSRTRGLSPMLLSNFLGESRRGGIPRYRTFQTASQCNCRSGLRREGCTSHAESIPAKTCTCQLSLTRRNVTAETCSKIRLICLCRTPRLP
jgi:hypothetical protein